MFILILGNSLDENSKNNPLLALVRIVEKNEQLKKQAEQAWNEQSEAINLKLKDKIRESTLKLNKVEMELMTLHATEMELMDIVPIEVDFRKN
jgi:hypothetical protein